MTNDEKLIKQAFPGTVNETRARECASDLFDALAALRKHYRGHTVSLSKLREEVEDILAEGLMAYGRMEAQCEDEDESDLFEG